MKCPKCKSKVNKDEKFCGNCGNEIISINRKMQAIIACICCFVIVLNAIIVGLYFYNSTEIKIIGNSEYNSFMEDFTDVLVTDEESAIEAVGSVSAALGIDNAVEELKINNVQSVKDDRFYRMQQYYKDIPVFGRSIVVSADKNGNVLSLTSNYKQTVKDIDLVPQASQTEISESIAEYLKIDNLSIQNLSNDNLVIYNLNEKDVLAYSVAINGLGTIIVDANTAEVIHYIKLFKDITAEVKSKDGSVSSIGWQNDDGSYHLYNDEHKIEVFDVKGIDTVIDNEGRVHTNFKDYGIDTIYSKNNKFDTDAIILLNDVIDISNYYNDLGFSGFEQVHVAINDSYDNGKNARGGGGEFDGKDCAIILIGKKYNFANKDVTAHEYTHAVSGLNVGWSGTHTENSALNEAYSDILGSLYENNQNPDWKMVHLSEVIRDLTDPSQTNSYDNMADIDDADGYNQYTLSTIVSHSAYLMWNGIDGSENRKINAATLSEIWYRSMLLLQSNADFAQCRNAVELSARMMLKNNQLTEEQYRTVVTAFESVGIENATFTYTETVKNKFDLSVLSSKETGNVQFKLEVIKMPTIKVGPGIINNEMPKPVMEKTVITGRQSLDLKNGTYVLRITDVSDECNISKSINIKIVVEGNNSNAKDEVVVNTDFTEIITVIVDSKSRPDWVLGLTEGYWESKIQTFELYKFNEDGTGKIYCVADMNVVDTAKLDKLDSANINSFTWKVDGEYLIINDSCKLKFVSKSDNYNWDMGIYHRLPENEKFFYETDFVVDEFGMSNAFYLAQYYEKTLENDVEAKQTVRVENHLSLTLTGTIIEEVYKINSQNKGKVFILNLDEPMKCAIYDEFMGYNGEEKNIDSVQINILSGEYEYYKGKTVTLTGSVMIAHTGHHRRDIVLDDCVFK